jgi:hypothetical protein
MFTTPQTYTTSSKWQVGRSIDGKCAEVDTRRNRRCPTWVWLGCAASTLLFKKQILAIGKRHWHGSKPSCSNFWDDFHRLKLFKSITWMSVGYQGAMNHDQINRPKFDQALVSQKVHQLNLTSLERPTPLLDSSACITGRRSPETISSDPRSSLDAQDFSSNFDM